MACFIVNFARFAFGNQWEHSAARSRSAVNYCHCRVSSLALRKYSSFAKPSASSQTFGAAQTRVCGHCLYERVKWRQSTYLHVYSMPTRTCHIFAATVKMKHQQRSINLLHVEMWFIE